MQKDDHTLAYDMIIQAVLFKSYHHFPEIHKITNFFPSWCQIKYSSVGTEDVKLISCCIYLFFINNVHVKNLNDL